MTTQPISLSLLRPVHGQLRAVAAFKEPLVSWQGVTDRFFQCALRAVDIGQVDPAHLSVANGSNLAE
jgi:hypothetical protein